MDFMEKRRKRRKRRYCQYCDKLLDYEHYYDLQQKNGRMHDWAERFCSLQCVALWVAEVG